MKAFISGASSGLGRALAREYATRYPDCVLGIAGRREVELSALADSLGTDLPGNVCCEIYPFDITDVDALRAAATDFTNRHGPPDVVIANAGISAATETGTQGDDAVFKRILDVNVCAMFTTFDAFLPAMQVARTGTLVGIGSVAGVRGLPGSGAYSASKAAVRSYLESLRVELHTTPLRVVTIAPGYIETPMTERNDYAMPFLMPADVFARKAVDAIEAGRRYVVIPWQMGWVATMLGLLPRLLFDYTFAKAPRKPRPVDNPAVPAEPASRADSQPSDGSPAPRVVKS